MATATHRLNIVIQVMDKATAPIKRVENNVRKLEATTKRASVNMLGLGLGLTFFMFGVQMQVERVVRSMFNVFQQAEGEMGAMNQQFNIIKANLAAISIAFFDAFAQSGLFKFVISSLTTITDWFLNLTDIQRQSIAEFVIKFLAWSRVISFVGQLVLALFVAFQVLKAGTLPFLIIGAGLILAWANGWDVVDVAIVAVGASMFLLVKRLVLIGGAFNLMASLWLGSFGLIFITLGFLMNRFGGFGNAMKAWASAIALAVAIVFQLALDGIITLAKFSAVALIHLIEIMNRIPKVNISTAGLTNFVTDFKVDLVGAVAQGLDKIGFNVQPVDAAPRTLESLLGSANEEVAAVQDKLLEEQKTFTSKLSEQISLQEEELIESQLQGTDIKSIAESSRELADLFKFGRTATEEDLGAPLGVKST